MSAVRAGLIDLVNKLEAELQGAVKPLDVELKLGIKSVKINKMLWDMESKGLLKKVKKGGFVYYTVTSDGNKYRELSKDASGIGDLKKWLISGKGAPRNKKSKTTAKKSSYKTKQSTASANLTQRYSSKAEVAINSISEVVDANERLVNTLRIMKSQIEEILKEHGFNDSQNSNS